MNTSECNNYSCLLEREAILEGCSDIVLIFNKELQVLSANKKAKKIVAQPMGMKCHEIFCGNQEKCNDCVINLTLTENSKEEKSKIVTLKQGDCSFSFGVSSIPITDTKGCVEKVVVIAHDITEQLRLEKHLKYASKMEAVGTLAGGIAHDFNNILTPIMGYAEIIRLGLLQDILAREDAISYIDNIIEASKRAQKLVKQILKFSRNEEADETPQVVYPIIKEGIKLFRSSTPSHIEIFSEIDETCGPVSVDPLDMHQILINLCNNAMEALADTPGFIKISLEQEIVDGHRSVLLRITDNGIGIAPDKIDRIFDPYYTTKEKMDGTGMGLAIVHGIVSRYQGKVRAVSTIAEGTTVSISLPVAEDEIENGQSDILENNKGNKQKILLVDDEQAVVRTTLEMLKRLDYEVTCELSPRKALLMFYEKAKEFDLVITDLSMPYMSGIELCEQMKQVRPDIPILLYSGMLEEHSRIKAVQAGVDGFCLKPATLTELAKTVYEFCP